MTIVSIPKWTLKEPYIFDFLTLEEPFHERELETKLLHQLERFLWNSGRVSPLLAGNTTCRSVIASSTSTCCFYHLKLRCFIVIDLRGQIQARICRQNEFLLKRRRREAAPRVRSASLGLILCQDRNRIVAEYALRGAETKKTALVGRADFRYNLGSAGEIFEQDARSQPRLAQGCESLRSAAAQPAPKDWF